MWLFASLQSSLAVVLISFLKKKKKKVREICNMSIRFKSAKKRPEKMEKKSKERLVI